MNWMYINPFWHEDRFMSSRLSPEECKRRLKVAPTSLLTVARLWISRGDVGFFEGGFGATRGGPLLEMHVRVDIKEGQSSGSLLRLRFSAGFGSAVVLSAAFLGCAAAFLWALGSLLSGASWIPLYGAGLLAIVVPALLVLALRAEAPDDERDLWNFIADQVDGEATSE